MNSELLMMNACGKGTGYSKAARPFWWSGSHSKALAAMTHEWQSYAELLAHGIGSLVLCELEHAKLIERKMDPLPQGRFTLPSVHVFYRLPQSL